MILLAILRLPERAYGVMIGREIEQLGKRTVTPAALYVALDRLEKSGLVWSTLGLDERARRARKAVLHGHNNGITRRPVYPTSFRCSLVWDSASRRNPHVSTAQPPKLATFLMERLAGCEPVLLGDLQEEYRAGQSRWWYWRETLSVVAWSLVGAIRSHPVKFLRAIAALIIAHRVAGFALSALPLESLLYVMPGWIYMRYQVYTLAWIALSFPLVRDCHMEHCEAASRSSCPSNTRCGGVVSPHRHDGRCRTPTTVGKHARPEFCSLPSPSCSRDSGMARGDGRWRDVRSSSSSRISRDVDPDGLSSDSVLLLTPLPSPTCRRESRRVRSMGHPLRTYS